MLLLLGDLDKYPQQPYLWKTHHGNRKPSAYRISGCKNTNHEEEEKVFFSNSPFFLEFRKSSRRHSGTINHIRVYKVGCCISQSFVLFSLWGKKEHDDALRAGKQMAYTLTSLLHSDAVALFI